MCAGKEAGAGSRTGAAGRVNPVLVIARWFCSTRGFKIGGCLASRCGCLFNLRVLEDLAAEGKHLGWISLKAFASSAPPEQAMSVFPSPVAVG